MLSQVFYLVRSKVDGQYLAAHPRSTVEPDPDRPEPKPESQAYLLMFREHADALSYLNKFAGDVADRFAVESISGTQINNLLNRWGYRGIGVVEDPLLPRVEFMVRDR